MNCKILGAAIIIITCGGIGYSFVATYRAELQSCRAIVRIIDYMECELGYHLTPLTDLCRQVAEVQPHIYGQVFLAFADELENQISPDTYRCMQAVILKSRGLTRVAQDCLCELGQTLGMFDLQGQLKSLAGIRQLCKEKLNELEQNKDVRIRNYQTLGLCAGAALAILLI